MTESVAAKQLEIALHGCEYALAQLPLASPIPRHIHGQFFAVVHTAEGITIVCDATAAPEAPKVERGFRCFEVIGSFDLASVGVVAAVAQPLADAGVSLFAYSAWQTDYILVHSKDVERTCAALVAAGHTVRHEEC
jgi:uncharacterized protein